MFQTQLVEEIKTHISYSVTSFENRTIYKIMCKNMVRAGQATITVWNMRIACWIPKARNKHSECVILFFYCNNGCTKALHCYATVHFCLVNFNYNTAD